MMYTATYAVLASLAAVVSADDAPTTPSFSLMGTAVNVTSDTAPAGQVYVRDSGYLGQIGSKTFIMSFDTELCDAVTYSDCVFRGTNSFSLLTDVASVVSDPADAYNLCNTADELGWVTNVWGLNDTHGIGFFLNVTHYPNGDEYIQGTSPVVFDVSTDTPVCIRLNDAVDFWTTGVNQGMYGEGGTFLGIDGYLYIYASQSGSLFHARVPFSVEEVSDLSSYTYWNGVDYVSDEADAVALLSTLSGSIFYSDYLEQYVWLTEGLGYDGVWAYVADNPQGPFSEGVEILTDTEHGGTYAPHALTTLDATGKTVVIVYSVPDSLSQRVQTISWDDTGISSVADATSNANVVSTSNDTVASSGNTNTTQTNTTLASSAGNGRTMSSLKLGLLMAYCLAALQMV